MTRITQVAYCCSQKYCRWRLPGRRFPRGHTHCCVCRCQLDWVASPGTPAAASLRAYYRRRQAYLIDGLTTRGTPRRLRRFLTDADRRQAEQQYNREKFQRRAARLTAAGLTTRGTPRKNNIVGHPINPVEQAWCEFRSQFQSSTPTP